MREREIVVVASMMGSSWKKVKAALGLNLNNLCLFVPGRRRRTLHHHHHHHHHLSNSSFHTFFTLSKTTTSSKQQQTCSICLTKMKQGCGHAIFIAECSHSFHFHCIASNVIPGNQICPVCRTNWKQIPLLGPGNQNDATKIAATRRLPLPLPPPRINPNHRHIPAPYLPPEPTIFDDDEPLNRQHEKSTCSKSSVSAIEIKTYPQFSAAPRSRTYRNFTILVNIKACAIASASSRNQSPMKQVSETRRAPIDLVTVLDISGSMAGPKFVLVKRAMRFVIQNLGTDDRLSVVAFSSTARRLFRLRKMSDSGRQQALQAVNSLVANGGTNIVEALRKGAKIMEDRKEKNPVAAIILLSDGQDTYTASSYGGYRFLLPGSLGGREKTGFRTPVHTFGFGADHDSFLMHYVSEISGGTFSFVETEAAIQDAVAQCIGGLLSVVVQELQVEIECVRRSLVGLVSVKSGSYPSRVKSGGNRGVVEFGDLYADEERDFLVAVNLPATSHGETSLIKVKCVYKNPLTEETEALESEEVKIQRPEETGEVVLSLEVDRQRNRLRSAEAMEEARALAERGDLSGAVNVLENCRKTISGTDRLCVGLEAEMKEMQERMVSREVYEESGRGYVLSGMSSHSRQRAAARGDSSSIVEAYQTPSMADMITRSSQDMLPFTSQPKPR